jgi:hypothetical protein
MATKKRSSPAGRGRARAKATPSGTAGDRIRETWEAAVKALSSAEAEAERQLRLLLARNRVKPAEARAALEAFRSRARKERKKAARKLEARLAALQVRLRRERKNAGRMVNDAVRGTLVALDIPSRGEVAELTRKVNELSRKIDGYRRRSSSVAAP